MTFSMPLPRYHGILFFSAFVFALMAPEGGCQPLPGETLHLGFESESELLSDFVTQFPQYVSLGRDGLAERGLAIEEGRFGKALHIRDGWPVSKGAWNESGLDCDLIVATMWGEWHKKPHFWGAGAFNGDRGTVAFWVKSATLNPGIVFMQGHVGWGRKERDLFSIEVDEAGRLSAFIRDVRYDYHRVTADEPTWTNGEWQHIAVTWDRAYGLSLYHKGKRIGSTWGSDAWWQTGHPGLFSPFLQESFYDEIRFFDRPLSDAEVVALFVSNTMEAGSSDTPGDSFDEAAKERLLSSFADVASLELPVVHPGQETLLLKQIVPVNCHDGKISAWWVMDGRYELAWPHPYRLFTFILGDVDFHGTRIDMDLPPGAAPNFVSLEGILNGVTIRTGSSDQNAEGQTLVSVDDPDALFVSRTIDTQGSRNLTIPLTEEYGSPPGLEGSAHLPVSGETRIHEIQLWHAETAEFSTSLPEEARVWFLSEVCSGSALPRYGQAVKKLAGSWNRTAVLGNSHPGKPQSIALEPLSSVHLFSPGLAPDMAVDSVVLQLLVKPKSSSDVLWLKLRDPANPARIWCKACVRVDFVETDQPQLVSIHIDIADLMLASEDRLWLELSSAGGTDLLLGDPERPSLIAVIPSSDRQASLAAYSQYELLPAELQYAKEYNYKPWKPTGEKVNLQAWSSFGGPYDMAYPPLAVLRHDPTNQMALTYEKMVFERGRRAWVNPEEVRRPIVLDVPKEAPEWAVWERELYRLNERAAHWIADRQRKSGEFWGGWNDDSFIPLGYAPLPLMGDEIARKAWLRFYDGLEEAGIFADGYCDIWPIDPLHITDFITSRGLMLAFGLGDPHVFERELRTSERYWQRLHVTNTRLARQGASPLTGDRADRDRKDVTLVEAMEAEIFKYSSTHVRWYWKRGEEPGPTSLADRSDLARRLMEAVQSCDEITLFDLTESMIHTDGQGGGAGGRDDLVAAALGGRLQGRIEPYPHSIAASWEGEPGADLARLVTYADDRSLSVNLYNFGSEPIRTNLRVWRLRKGLYDLSVGADANDDGMIDAPQPDSSQRSILRRFSTIPVKVPPQENTVLKLTQVEPLSEPENLPDLAVSSDDFKPVADGAVEITIHNIGSAPARDVSVAIVDTGGKVLAESSIDRLESPDEDYAARRATIRFENLPSLSGLTVRVDPGERIEEIFEENNAARIATESGVVKTE